MNTSISSTKLNDLWVQAQKNGMRPVETDARNWREASRGCLTNDFDCMIVRLGDTDRHYVRDTPGNEWREIQECCGNTNDGSRCDAKPKA